MTLKYRPGHRKWYEQAAHEHYPRAQFDTDTFRVSQLTHIYPDILLLLRQKAFQFLQTVVSSKPTGGNTQPPDFWIKEVLFQRSMSAGCQNCIPLKQTNKTSYASWTWDGGYEWVKEFKFSTRPTLLNPSPGSAEIITLSHLFMPVKKLDKTQVMAELTTLKRQTDRQTDRKKERKKEEAKELGYFWWLRVRNLELSCSCMRGEKSWRRRRSTGWGGR